MAYKLWWNFWLALLVGFYSALVTKIYYLFSNYPHYSEAEVFIVMVVVSFILLLGFNRC